MSHLAVSSFKGFKGKDLLLALRILELLRNKVSEFTFVFIYLRQAFKLLEAKLDLFGLFWVEILEDGVFIRKLLCGRGRELEDFTSCRFRWSGLGLRLLLIEKDLGELCLWSLRNGIELFASFLLSGHWRCLDKHWIGLRLHGLFPFKICLCSFFNQKIQDHLWKVLRQVLHE